MRLRARGIDLPRLAPFLLLLPILALLYRSPAQFVWRAWETDPYYTHGLPVALLALGLAAWLILRAPAQPGAHKGAVLALALLAGATYLAGLRLHNAYYLTWSLVPLLGAIALATGGAPRLKAAGLPLLLLAVTLPTPWMLDLGITMQNGAMMASAKILVLLGVALQSGLTTMEVDGITFEVNAACSGLQSAMSLLAIAAVVGVVAPKRRWLLLALALPIALVLNLARILAVVAVALHMGPAAAEGFFHGASSLLLFIAETLVLVLVAGPMRLPKREVAASV